jgi:hypothetical protein
MFATAEPNAEDIDEQLKVDAASYLPDHLSSVVRRAGSLRPVDDVESVYGDLIGRARVTHVRAAIKQLHAAGLVNDNGIGDFWARKISWTG